MRMGKYWSGTDIDAEEKAFQSFGLVKHFFPGVGDYFVSVVLAGMFYLMLSFATTYLALKVGVRYIGAVDVDFEKMNAAAASSLQSLQAYFESLPVEKVVMIKTWFLYLMAIANGFQFVTLWWIPAIFYKSKNPFIAFVEAIKFLFRKFWATVVIYSFLLMFNLVVSMINSFSYVNVVISLIGFILFFYFTTYCVVLIFLYYGKNGERTAKDYIYSGDDCDGEKLAGSEPSSED